MRVCNESKTQNCFGDIAFHREISRRVIVSVSHGIYLLNAQATFGKGTVVPDNSEPGASKFRKRFTVSHPEFQLLSIPHGPYRLLYQIDTEDEKNEL